MRKIKGGIGRYHDGKLFGWAKHSEHDRSVRLIVTVNNIEITRTVADMAKPWLAKKNIGHGNYGFQLEIASGLPEDKPAIIRIFEEETGEEIANSPMMLDPGNLAQQVFYFIHIPKTAGTSFREMLTNTFDQSGIFPNIQDLINNRGQYPNLLAMYDKSIDEIVKIKVITGHWPITVFLAQPFSGKSLTFFREPIARVISHIRHFQRHEADCRNLSLAEILAIRKDNVKNIQSRFILEKGIRITELYKKTDDEIKLILQKSLRQLDFFGLTERFDDSIRIFENQFAITFEETIYTNKAPKKIDIPGEVIDNIKQSERIDLMLYEIALEEFQKKFEAITASC